MGGVVLSILKNPTVTAELVALGLTLAGKLIEKRAGKTFAFMTTEELLAEIAAAKAALTDSAKVYDDAVAGKKS